MVSLFRDDPRLAFDLLRSVFGIELPPLTQYTDRKGELDRHLPITGDTGELRMDLALSAELEQPEHRRAGIAVIVEVQKRINSVKRWRLWVYWALLAEQLKRNTAVLVVPLSKAVGRWSRGLGRLEIPMREGLLVLDHENMPRITDLELARLRPALVVLSAVLHAINGDYEIAQIAWDVAGELADERRWRYAAIILSAVPQHERDRMIGDLTMEERHELTELELNSIAYHDGRDDGKREGMLAGKREGMLAGKREGLLEGKREVLAELVFTILELRELPVDAASRAKIQACSDPDLLQRWAARAKQASETANIFD
ncbi:hypothetical protein [Enhygromyxa salina]|uniref:hypothetical protein n=1 Tax=Enhygromyxa salina TaxID=215803 RepID=UPI0011B246A6|nr:hypothetical protein [Enhygromyxa salina]